MRSPWELVREAWERRRSDDVRLSARELERALRDAGLSRKAAATIVSRIKAGRRAP